MCEKVPLKITISERQGVANWLGIIEFFCSKQNYRSKIKKYICVSYLDQSGVAGLMKFQNRSPVDLNICRTFTFALCGFIISFLNFSSLQMRRKFQHARRMLSTSVLQKARIAKALSSYWMTPRWLFRSELNKLFRGCSSKDELLVWAFVNRPWTRRVV